jgi:hypothetical protein
MKASYEDLVKKLIQLYGSFDKEHKKFEKAPNSEISRELGYSDAQFSRLINESATEGEYIRANKNAERILTLLDYEQQIAEFRLKKNRFGNGLKHKIGFLALGFLLGLLMVLLPVFNSGEVTPEDSKFGMLEWAFESNFINPYTSLRDLPADCNFQCYKYQGKWELSEEYKLPFLRESSGFHYLAKSVTAYVRCSPNENAGGKTMDGYEYQEHEIWYDLLERPIKTFIGEDGSPYADYKEMKFSEEENFIKIGTIHSFYTNEFTLDSVYIYRNGQDIGREIEFVSDELLANQVNDEQVFERIKREMTLIAQDPLRDFSRPSECNPANRALDFHAVNERDEMSFNCQMTTAGRFPIKYTKTYVLVDQFIKDQCVSQM